MPLKNSFRNLFTAGKRSVYLPESRGLGGGVLGFGRRRALAGLAVAHWSWMDSSAWRTVTRTRLNFGLVIEARRRASWRMESTSGSTGDREVATGEILKKDLGLVTAAFSRHDFPRFSHKCRTTIIPAEDPSST